MALACWEWQAMTERCDSPLCMRLLRGYVADLSSRVPKKWREIFYEFHRGRSKNHGEIFNIRQHHCCSGPGLHHFCFLPSHE